MAGPLLRNALKITRGTIVPSYPLRLTALRTLNARIGGSPCLPTIEPWTINFRGLSSETSEEVSRTDQGVRERTPRSRRVFIANLPWHVDWPELKNFMRQAGEVTFVKVLQDHEGKSKGSAIAEFATEMDAQNAINTLHDAELGGRSILVRQDRDPLQNGSTQDGSEGFQQSGSQRHGGDGTELYVGNLPWSIRSGDLQALFGEHVKVESAEVFLRQDGKSRGFGFVKLADLDDVETAIEKLNGIEVEGRTIAVRR